MKISNLKRVEMGKKLNGKAYNIYNDSTLTFYINDNGEYWGAINNYDLPVKIGDIKAVEKWINDFMEE